MDLRYKLDDTPPFGEFVLFGLQWLAISVPGIIVIGKVVGGLHVTDPSAQISYLQKLAFVIGIVLVSQVLLGHRLPLIIGPSTVLLVGMIASAGFDPATMYASIMIGGGLLFLTAVTGLFGRLQKLFTFRVVAVVLLLIAFTLMPTVLGLLIPPGPVLPHQSMSFAFLLILCMFVSQRYLPPVWKSAIIFFAMIAGTCAWVIIFPSSSLHATPRGLPVLSGFFYDFTTSFSVAPGVIVSFLFCFLGLSINDLGSIESVSVLLKLPDMRQRVNRGISLTGLANVASGFFGVIGPVNFSLSPGVILSTGCASRFTLVLTGVLLVLLAFSPAVLGLVESVPPVVMGCVLTYLLTFQIAAGFATIGQEEKGFRLESGIVVGLPVLMGTAVSMLPARILGTFPPVLRPVIGNGFVIGVLVAFILEHVVYKERKGRAFQE
ncbi:MAG: solute carrier family 23 protein [Syntrophorhabdales bacterium]|jgi:xanthine/uracil permease